MQSSSCGSKKGPSNFIMIIMKFSIMMNKYKFSFYGRNRVGLDLFSVSVYKCMKTNKGMWMCVIEFVCVYFNLVSVDISRR